MWLTTSDGFFSASSISENDISHGYDFQVRGRNADHLGAFISRCNANNIQCSEIIHTPERDYDYRIYIMRRDFLLIMMEMIMQIDYECVVSTIDEPCYQSQVQYICDILS